MQTTEDPGPTISPRGATGVGVASAVGALSGYLVMVIASRTLDTASNGEFLTFWSLLFFFFGVLGGIQNETTRAVGASVSAGAATTRLMPAALLLGGGLAAVTAASSPWWGAHVLGSHWQPLVLALCFAVVAFAGHSVLCGVLAGGRVWGSYSVLVAAESTVRLTLTAVVWLLGATKAGFGVAAALAAGTWILLSLVSRPVRSAIRARATLPRSDYLARAGQAMVATASSAALVVGFTVLLRATSTVAEFKTAAPFVVAVSLTRAPLLVPLTAYQGVAITYVLANRGAGLRPLVRLAASILGIGGVAAGAAWLVGPWLLRLLFGHRYGVPGPTLATLTIAGAVLAVLTLTGAVALALDRHRSYAVGWFLATATSVGMLLLPLPLEARAQLSLVAGPVLGVVVHTAAIVGARRA